ncbi:MAG: murein transglycosylase D [Ewingella americana]|jgi:membrane-bound lytic murein transglycosylase D|uniref:peptidoglycan lytic exotransglycosylase n=1 Tax=Ewingella americana TaxID=41202 RepID=A0A2N0MY81_9GAMM|nr:murein transglycosylase D [Ewingella americana]KAA8728685.1 murein transglycosylase D [Ewingella americana]MCI1676543.1 murein transglycosylase D [Ewingella americana]MCI1853867.1 murein transglycosylase D [Ewingella americana]MCI1859892.1 murein transglycosylase D [Ewingella americana]MCI2142220.1 murein transglycosylase D [Ewingella americana]
MKAKAIIFASVLLVGCQASRQDVKVPEQHAQSLSSASQSEAGEYTDGGRLTSSRWLDNDDSIAQKNLWNFIGDELKMKVPENARIREQKVKYLKNKSYLHDVTLRAEPYMYWITEQIKKRNMPMELVLLPIVESAFDPKATSAANAAGLWQIVPQTGRNYGLKQNQWYDGRRDVVASTTAALDMMQNLNKMFGGDWLLTIAAYNSGEGRVMQAVKANKAKGRPTDFWSLALPRETSIYVPKMLALSDILKHSKKYGISLPTPSQDRALARVEVGQQMQLTQAAEMAGMSLTKLKSYNTGYKQNVTAPNGPHYIVLPTAHAAQLKDSLADGDIAAVQNTRLASNAPSGAKAYKVRSGDSLSGIAARLNVKTRDLQRWNNLRSASAIKVGQTLQVADNSVSSASSSNGGSITYQVRKGDSLSSIAKRHGVNIKDVMRWNAGTDNLQPGNKLTLFVSNKLTPDT